MTNYNPDRTPSASKVDPARSPGRRFCLFELIAVAGIIGGVIGNLYPATVSVATTNGPSTVPGSFQAWVQLHSGLFLLFSIVGFSTAGYAFALLVRLTLPPKLRYLTPWWRESLDTVKTKHLRHSGGWHFIEPESCVMRFGTA